MRDAVGGVPIRNRTQHTTRGSPTPWSSAPSPWCSCSDCTPEAQETEGWPRRQQFCRSVVVTCPPRSHSTYLRRTFGCWD